MDTALERGRCALEEIDALEELAVEVLKERVVGAKASMERDLVVAEVAKAMAWRAAQVEGQQASLGSEVGLMRGPSAFLKFYPALKETKEYYARHGGRLAFLSEQRGPEAAIAGVKRKVAEVHFSGEEVWGKYVDMAKLHHDFCNLPDAVVLDYCSYLRMMLNRPFSSHLLVDEDADGRTKKTAHYARYVDAVLDYLEDYWRRARPLETVESTDGATSLEKRNGALTGEMENEAPKPLDLEHFHSPEELESLGLDRLKEALAALGLKAGGDLKTRARRLFAVKGLDPDDVDPKLKSKNTKKASLRTQVAAKETRIEKLLERLAPALQASLRRAERKLTRTKEEIDQEIEDEIQGPRHLELPEKETAKAEDDDDVDDPFLDAPLYNPKNLPLGWDGKPIPYWLYKLHGLDESFECEICGNHTYWGRRAFEQHFTEWRHAHGMRCLRIPNTKHFHGVTKMDDAIALWEQLQERADKERFNPARDEEYEDSDGNVLNRATFEDLARMGLL